MINHKFLLRLKQIVLCIIVLLLLYYPFYNGDSKSEIAVMDKMITAQLKLDTMIKQDANGLKNFFGMDAKQMQGFVLYTSKSMMDVNEVLIIKLKAGDDGQALRKAIEKRVDIQLKNFNGYGTNQTDLLNHNIITLKKGYLFYAVSPHANTWEQCFLSEL